MNYLLWADLEGLKDNLKEVESALAILKQVGFPEKYVVNVLQEERKRLMANLAEEEKYL